jgi:hypothetical protein
VQLAVEGDGLGEGAANTKLAEALAEGVADAVSLLDPVALPVPDDVCVAVEEGVLEAEAPEDSEAVGVELPEADCVALPVAEGVREAVGLAHPMV